jgi:hypothetical protein
MKKTFIASALVLCAASANAQNNVHLEPNGGNVCNPMQISLHIHGNSFNPISYLWSTGETTPTISINTSGTYSVTIVGHHGNSPNIDTLVRTANYNVLAEPTITALTDLWVCKGDTVRLAAVAGYDFIDWSNGATGTLFEKKMNNIGTPGFPALDTMSVSYTATIDKVCSVTSDAVLLRSIRKPHGVGRAYEGRMNLHSSDSIPAGLVLEYLYPVTYEMSFTDNANPSNILKYVTAPGSRKAPASMLSPGSTYTVVTTPIINGIKYCPGAPSTIGMASGSRLALGFTEEEGIKTYTVYDLNGRKLIEKQAEEFNKEWLEQITPQMLIIHKTGITTEVIKMQLVR